MPVIRYVPQDPTDKVLQGELLRANGFDARPEEFTATIVFPELPQFDRLVGDEDSWLPMNSFVEVSRLSMRRNKEASLRVRANAGISTPCGEWIAIDYQPLIRYRPGGHEQLFLSGTTRDSAGVALGNCVVQIFRTINDTLMTEFTSAGDGTWSYQTNEPGPFYYVCYLAGSPDRAGTSLNTNVPTKVN